MPEQARTKRSVEKAMAIVKDAGGKVVGRTRLQKIAYILEIAGVGEGFSFEYRHYGPYSEDLAIATQRAGLLGLIHEDEKIANWGGTYSVFTTDSPPDRSLTNARRKLAEIAASADPVELELAATAAFLCLAGEGDPWAETAKRKPNKAGGARLRNAQRLFRRLREVDPSNSLPDI